MAISFKGAHFPKEVILIGVRWYLAYPLSTRHVEELMEERGVELDHTTINRWVIKYSPQLEAPFHRRKRPVWTSWRLDETYIRVKGAWKYLYRAVDKYGKTIDFVLTAHRDEAAAKAFLTKAIRRHGGVPETITIDGSTANEAAIKSYNEDHDTSIEIRKGKYLNNIVEQDHRGVKRITRPMMGFKSFDAAQATLCGIELMRMIKKEQRAGEEMKGLSAAEQFYALASSSHRRTGLFGSEPPRTRNCDTTAVRRLPIPIISNISKDIEKHISLSIGPSSYHFYNLSQASSLSNSPLKNMEYDALSILIQRKKS